MTESLCGWITEEIIDLILGELPPAKSERLQLHLAACAHCRKQHEKWEAILPEPGSVLPLPSHQVRTSLQTAQTKRRLRERILRSGSWRAGAASLIILLLLAVAWVKPWDNAHRRSLTAADDIEGLSLMSDPQAVVYSVGRPIQYQVSGFVWFNGSSNRMLIVLEGIVPSSERVYQAWTVSRNEYSNIGVLKHTKGRSHLYVEGKQLEQADNIMVSIEPIGGSLTPSMPEMFVISLQGSKLHQFHKRQQDVQQDEPYDDI